MLQGDCNIDTLDANNVCRGSANFVGDEEKGAGRKAWLRSPSVVEGRDGP